MAVAACDGSSKGAVASPTPSGDATTCSWPAGLDLHRQPVVVLQDNSHLFLVDLRSGRIRARCDPYSDVQLAGIRARATVAGQPAYGGPTGDWLAWFGGLRPGGTTGSQVAADTGVRDLATGTTTSMSVPGFAPSALAGRAVVMVSTRPGPPRYDNTPQSIPTRPADWCVVDSVHATTCHPVPGATTPGTPVPHADGSVGWAPLAASAVAGTVDGTNVYVRTDGRRLLATATSDCPGRACFRDAFMSADVDGWTPRFAGNDNPTRPVTWYTTSGRTAAVAHRATATWQDVLTAAGWPTSAGQNQFRLNDAAITDSGRSVLLYVQANDPSHHAATRLAFVRVDESERATRLCSLDAGGPGNDAGLVSLPDALPAGSSP